MMYAEGSVDWALTTVLAIGMTALIWFIIGVSGDRRLARRYGRLSEQYKTKSDRWIRLSILLAVLIWMFLTCTVAVLLSATVTPKASTVLKDAGYQIDVVDDGYGYLIEMESGTSCFATVDRKRIEWGIPSEWAFSINTDTALCGPNAAAIAR